MKIAIVGASGLVGSMMLKVLEEFGITKIELLPCASIKSIGKSIRFAGKTYSLISIEEALKAKPQMAIFSAGSTVSLQYAPLFAKNGCTVIDNSSAWRMYEHIPLIVPEINASLLKKEHKIIANPNCSTIQLVMALAPIHKKYGIKRLVISTYQSVSGTGVKAIEQLENEINGVEGEKVYPYPIHKNVLPHGGVFEENGYTSEEMKLVNETRKILHDPMIAITATVVRVPVSGGHSEAVNVETRETFCIEDVKKEIGGFKGVKLLDDPQRNIYPMPLYCFDKNEVFVGRIRQDVSRENCFDMWVVADNLRKGAATNAVQIAAYLIDKKMI